MKPAVTPPTIGHSRHFLNSLEAEELYYFGGDSWSQLKHPQIQNNRRYTK